MIRASLLVALLLSPFACQAAEFTVERTEQGAVVRVDGQLFTEYLTKSGTRPALWPIMGPTNKPMTRAFPMKSGQAGEKQDHPWHRSLWFTHGEVNHIDFWVDRPDEKAGKIVHRSFEKLAGGEQAVIVTRNDWMSPDLKTKVLEDERTFTFGADDKARWIDVEVVLKATEGPVMLGDTKEGSFGVRVAGTMKVEAEPGGKIVNSRGQTNEDAWGQPAEWVDYYGPVEGERLGIAILNHPSSYGFPTHWHVRTYGLFAANPFGTKAFSGGKKASGAVTLQPGETLTLRYRVLLHQGDTEEGRVAEVFEAYSQQKP